MSMLRALLSPSCLLVATLMLAAAPVLAAPRLPAATVPAEAALHMSFINPGRSDETYWLDAARGMQAAADSLGVQLEMRYAERDPLQQIALVRELAARPAAERPDYLIVSGEKGTLVEQIRLATGAGIRTFVAYSSVLGADRAQLGQPRERYPLWLGSLLPDPEQAGYLTARALIAAGPSAATGAGGRAPLALLAIAGDRSTESSVRRNRGLQRALAEQPQVQLLQTVYGDWRRDKAQRQAAELYARYPQARLIWAGNDEMAFGAMDALVAAGGQPGRDRLFSAINTSPAAMQAVIDGRLAALAGGHFMTGAWAVVMLHDHARGHDFADEGLELSLPMFTLFTPELARRYLQRFASGPLDIDFRVYSKHHNRQLHRYAFSFAHLLDAPVSSPALPPVTRHE